MALTDRQREVLRILVRSGETWAALMQIFEEEAQHSLKIQDEIVEAIGKGRGDVLALSEQVAWHTATRQVYVNLAQLIDNEAHRKQD